MVKSPPAFEQGVFSMTANVYLERQDGRFVILTHLDDAQRGFTLAVGEDGKPRASARSPGAEWVTVTGNAELPLNRWCHVVTSLDGEHLRLYLDGKQIGVEPCSVLKLGHSETLWFGTDGNDHVSWRGRIDELALFTRPLLAGEVEALNLATQELVNARRRIQADQ